MEILDKTEKNGAYSNLLLNESIQKNNLSSADAGLLTELVYGVLQRRLTLDFYLADFLDESKKIDSWVRNLLRLSIYQMIYLDKIPQHAILFEAAEIAKKKGHVGISKFVNGVLRNAERRGFKDLTDIKDDAERLSLEISMPLWLVEKFINQIGYSETKALGESLLIPSRASARVNQRYLTVEEALYALEEEGFAVRRSEITPDAVISDGGHFASSPLFTSGQLTIQDETSMLVAPALQIEPHHQVLDACAALAEKQLISLPFYLMKQGEKLLH